MNLCIICYAKNVFISNFSGAAFLFFFVLVFPYHLIIALHIYIALLVFVRDLILL